MLEALFGQIKGVFGKGFLFAGLLPSVVLALGWRWYRVGSRGLETTIGQLLQRPGEATPEILLDIAAVLGLALCFFTGRSLALYTFQTLPGRLLTPLRYWLTRRQLLRRRAASLKLDEALWRYTVLCWHRDSFERPKTIPRWIAIPNENKALRHSRSARGLVLFLSRANKPLASFRQKWIIRRGLSELYILGRDQYEVANFVTEITEWKSLYRDAAAAEVVDSLETDAYRKAVLAGRHSRSFPSDQRWLQPTVLGNRLAALDDYAEDRYGIDTSTLWTRLIGIITADERAEVNDAQLTVEVLINLSVALIALTILILFVASPGVYRAYSATTFEPHWRTITFLGASLILARGAYQSAVYAVGALSEKVVRLVDLYSFQLLSRLGFKSPQTVGNELILFGELRAFFTEGYPLPRERELSRPGEDKQAANKRQIFE